MRDEKILYRAHDAKTQKIYKHAEVIGSRHKTKHAVYETRGEKEDGKDEIAT